MKKLILTLVLILSVNTLSAKDAFQIQSSIDGAKYNLAEDNKLLITLDLGSNYFKNKSISELHEIISKLLNSNKERDATIILSNIEAETEKSYLENQLLSKE